MGHSFPINYYLLHLLTWQLHRNMGFMFRVEGPPTSLHHWLSYLTCQWTLICSLLFHMHRSDESTALGPQPALHPAVIEPKMSLSSLTVAYLETHQGSRLPQIHNACAECVSEEPRLDFETCHSTGYRREHGPSLKMEVSLMNFPRNARLEVNRGRVQNVLALLISFA